MRALFHVSGILPCISVTILWLFYHTGLMVWADTVRGLKLVECQYDLFFYGPVILTHVLHCFKDLY